MQSLLKSIATFSFLSFTVVSSKAQSSSPVSFFAIGGIKTNHFEQVLKMVSASNISPNYRESDINPEVKNTLSFFLGMYTSKPLSKRFNVSNTLGLDMQQLYITSGLQRQTSIGGITAYGTTNNTDLLARLKLDFGVNYNIVAGKKDKFYVGLRAGQMITLSGKTNSYSIVGADLRYEHKRNALFVSGTLSPYRTKIKGLKNYVGNINAELVIAEYAYRIYELNIGYAVRL